MNMNQKTMDALLDMVSKKMGTSPEKLKQGIQSGNMNQLTQGMSAEEAAKFKQILSNKELAQKIASSPEAQDLMKKMSGKK